MFESLTPSNSEEKTQIAAEKRQQGYIKDQLAMNAATNPAEDRAYQELQERRSDLLKWQQDLEDELFSLVMTLRGLEIGPDEKMVKASKPLCNEKFIYEVIIPQCKPFYSRNLINSNFDERGILMMLKNTMNDIADAMADAWDGGESKYDIEFTSHDLVMRLIKNAIRPAPYRALKGWTKKMDSSAIRRIEAYQETSGEPQTNKGIFGFFKGG